jgi:hypothetical protein
MVGHKLLPVIYSVSIYTPSIVTIKKTCPKKVLFTLWLLGYLASGYRSWIKKTCPTTVLDSLWWEGYLAPV